MADEPKKTPQDIENELSVGNFAAQQARTIGFQVGGLVAGLGAGFLANKAGLGKVAGKKALGWFGKTASGEIKQVEKFGKWLVTATSAVVGMTVGGIASLYEHWVKVERERLSVQEINKDVESLMEKRVQFEDTLDKQHDVVKAMLERQQAAGIVSHAGKEASRREERSNAERQPG